MRHAVKKILSLSPKGLWSAGETVLHKLASTGTPNDIRTVLSDLLPTERSMVVGMQSSLTKRNALWEAGNRSCDPKYDGPSRVEIVTALLSGIDLKDRTALIMQGDENGDTPVHQMMGEKDHDSLKEMVREIEGPDKFELNMQRTKNGRTPICRAAAHGFTAGVEIMLERLSPLESDQIVNEPDGFGCTPLHCAAEFAYHNRKEMVTLLLERGAIASLNTQDNDGLTPLHYLARNGDTEVMEMLLGKGGLVSLNTQDKCGLTPLHYATCGGHIAVIELLLAYGADKNIRSYQQWKFERDECPRFIFRGSNPIWDDLGRSAFDMASIRASNGSQEREVYNIISRHKQPSIAKQDVDNPRHKLTRLDEAISSGSIGKSLQPGTTVSGSTTAIEGQGISGAQSRSSSPDTAKR